jgi:hypothetical protein
MATASDVGPSGEGLGAAGPEIGGGVLWMAAGKIGELAMAGINRISRRHHRLSDEPASTKPALSQLDGAVAGYGRADRELLQYSSEQTVGSQQMKEFPACLIETIFLRRPSVPLW